MRASPQSITVASVVVPFIATLPAFGQVTLDPRWPENPLVLGGAAKNRATNVQRTVDGGYIVAGQTESFGEGEEDVYLIKLDSLGNLDPAWEPNPKTFGGEARDLVACVQPTADGGFVLAGKTTSFGADDWAALVVKFDALGNLDPAWSPNPKTFKGPDPLHSSGYTTAEWIERTADGGYIVAGIDYTFTASRGDVYLLKLDAGGEPDPVWDPNPKTYDRGRSELADCIRQTEDGGYVVVGRSVHSSDPGERNILVYRLDAAGNLDPAWSSNPKVIDCSAGAAQSLLLPPGGGYIVAGPGCDGTSPCYIHLIKLTASGDLDPAWAQNSRVLAGDPLFIHYSTKQTSDGGCIIAGCGPAGAGASLAKVSADGNLDATWDPNPRVFGPWLGEARGTSYASGVQPTPEGGYVVVGTVVNDDGGLDSQVFKLTPATTQFLRTDCNADGRSAGISDAVFLLRHNFLGTAQPPCLAACDANGDGDVTGTTDAVYILSYFFRGGPPPPSPFPDCGPGQGWWDGVLGCDTELPCP